MDRRELHAVVAVVALLALGVWFLSFGGGAKVTAQLDAAAGAGGGGAAGLNGSISTGTAAEKWKPYVPAGAHMGKHRMYRHPKSCSPNMNAPQQLAYDWRFSPPSEGDL